MSIERIVLIAVWSITIFGILLLTPRNRIREAWMIFLFKQFQTWLFGLLVVEFGLIVYPVREFPIASGTSFSFEYFIYPAVCIVFILHYPAQKSWLHRVGWYVFFPTWMTILEVLIERYTLLIRYVDWAWYWSWTTFVITFYFSRLFYLWFVKKGVPPQRL